MNNLRIVSASLIVALLLIAPWSAASRSKDQRGQVRVPAARATSAAQAQKNLLAKPEGMNAEERIIRDVYARLMRYQSAAIDEKAATTGEPAAPADFLTYQLRNLHSGPISEIEQRPLSEIVTSRGGDVVDLKAVRLSQVGGPPHAYYEALWTIALPAPPQGKRSQESSRFANFNRYTLYDVKVQLKGKQRIYWAMAVYRLEDSTRRPAQLEILDNITVDMNAVYRDESPRVHAPWNKYVWTGLYRAVAKAIKETREAGKPVRPDDAPIGYLPGDDAATLYTDQQAMMLPIDGGGGGDDGGGGGGGGGTSSCNTTVDRIQYQSGTTFVDIPGTLYVLKDTPVTFKALPSPATATFASGQPVWSGTSGATGMGDTVSVTFSTASTSLTNFKTVIATAGNSVTVNVVVYQLTGVLTAQENFTGRSNTDFGVGEVVNLSFTAAPAVTAGQAGGLLWKQTTGNGTLTAATDGTGTYTAANSPENVTLKLEVQSGPSKGRGPDSNIHVIAPSGAYQVQNPGSGIKHVLDTCSAGFQAITYLLPKTVSFIHIEAREGTTTAAATGWLAPSNGAVHSTGSWLPVANCNSSTGCQIQAIDSIYNQYPQNFGGTMWGNGDFQWNIPREWRVGTGTATQYTTLLHHFVSDAAGKGTISKGGAGPFSKNAGDPTSNF